MEVKNMNKKLFESTTEGIIRYFVRPNDDFVLNSLEKIDANEYLYRVLKNEGYKRIVFVEIEKTNCKYYTYDKLSHLSLQHQKEFANVIPDSLESISDFFSRVKAKIDKNDSGPAGLKKMGSKSEATYDKIPEFGKREIKRFSKLEEFVADFANYVSNALEAENIKTAVVLQMEVFEQSFNKELGIARRIASQLGDIVRYCEKNNSAMQNIIVLTTTQKEDFRNLVNNELLHNFHSWIPEVLSETTSGSMLVRNITDRLNEYGCLVMSESIGVDEIANLLLRKKIVDNDAMFDGLPFSKIYPLAEKLRIHLTYETKVFSDNIPFKRRKSFINPLNALLQRRTVVEELIAYVQGLDSKAINNVNTQSVSVERVFHNRIKYIDIDESAEILVEFDKLAGDEIQDAKRDALRAVNYFEGVKKELEEKEKQGKKINPDDYPYYNMLFFGAPGTGKTTIANLVGRLMYAKGILPTSKVHVVQAGELGSGIVHGVQENLFKEAEKAVGGVLLIDELQALKDAYREEGGSRGGGMAEDLMRALVSIINKYRDCMCVILCGYEEDVLSIIKFDDGASRRFPKKIKLSSYSIDTLMVIFNKLLDADGKSLGKGVEEKIRKFVLADMKTQGKTFGNVGYLKEELIAPIKAAYFERGQYDNNYTIEDLMTAFADTDKRTILEECEDSIQAIISEFDKLEGDEIQDAKRDVLRAVNYFEGMKKELEEKEKQGKKVSADDFPYLNMLFFGAPGTGKTTIANLVGRLMYAKGILPTSKVHIVQASELGSGRVHGVQEKLFEEAEKAIGGVLLIDELQAIKGEYQGGDLAEDFMRGLVSVINKYRDNMCVILCGYEEEVLRIIKYDDGTGRRFPKKIKLASYSIDTLMVILNKLLEVDNKSLESGVEEILRNIILADMKTQGKTFGNVGYLKEELIAPIKAAYFERGQYDNIYTIADVEVAFPTMKNNKDSEEHKAKQRHYKRVSRSIFEKISLPSGFQGYDEENISETERRDLIRTSILFISTDKGKGTAFLISPDGYALTCNHVIDGANEINARLRIPGRVGRDDSDHKCTVINTKESTDMALIKLEGKNFPYLPIAGEEREILDGETFTLSGYPLGKEEDLTSYTGYIANQTGMTDSFGKKYRYIEGEAKKGNSGSPLVSTRDGKVIGILFGSDIDDHDEMNKMRPIKYFWEEFLK